MPSRSDRDPRAGTPDRHRALESADLGEQAGPTTAVAVRNAPRRLPLMSSASPTRFAPMSVEDIAHIAVGVHQILAANNGRSLPERAESRDWMESVEHPRGRDIPSVASRVRLPQCQYWAARARAST